MYICRIFGILAILLVSSSYGSEIIKIKNVADVYLAMIPNEIYDETKYEQNLADIHKIIMKHVFPFLNGQDFCEFMHASKQFYTYTTKYLETQFKFGLMQIISQNETQNIYEAKIKEINNNEKHIFITDTRSNLTLLPEIKVVLKFKRLNFYFPFMIEFLDDICKRNTGPKRIYFSPKTNIIFLEYISALRKISFLPEINLYVTIRPKKQKQTCVKLRHVAIDEKTINLIQKNFSPTFKREPICSKWVLNLVFYLTAFFSLIFGLWVVIELSNRVDSFE
jgi:hypothetical protein